MVHYEPQGYFLAGDSTGGYNARMKTVVLHGYLKALYPHPIEVAAKSAADAISFLKLIPELTPKMGTKHSVQIAGFDTKEALYAPTDEKEIHVVPFIGGSKRGGLLQIVIGVALIALAIAAPGTLFGAGALLEGAAGSVALMGAAALTGGLLSFFSPAPRINTGGGETNESARYLSAGQNTVKAGTRIPIIYGRDKVAGHFLSFNVDAVEVDPGNTTPVVSGGGGSK